jgi:energy-coupling factor transporter transmembrane protein EcfT
MIAIKQPSGRYTFKINPASKSASLFLKVVSVFIILGFFGFIAFIVYNLAVGSNPF